MPILGFIAGYYRQLVDATKELFIRILMAILIFLGYVLLSLFIYAVMRRIMVPQKLHVVPVHLRYDSKCLVSQPKIHHISDCSFPQANILLNNGNKLLRSGHTYSVVLELEVPDSSANVDAGVFMVNLTFYTAKGQYLATSARPTIVHYKSFLLKTMHAIFFALPLLLGFMEQKQTLELVLFENYYEPYGDGSLSAAVFVETHSVHIYSSQLVFSADFSGFTYYLYQWPISMSIIVVISILITLCTCTLMLWVKDVIHDFDERRSLRLRRRRQVQQQLPRGPPHRGREVRQVAVTTPVAEHRQDRQQRPPPLHEPPPAAAGLSSGQGAPETVGGRGSTEARANTPTSTNTHESSAIPGNTRSSSDRGALEGAEFGDVISTLHDLRQELDDDDQSSITEDGSTDGAELRLRSVPTIPGQSD